MMLYRKNDAPLDFDYAEVTKKSADNPVFYVQYAHARSRSVFRNAHEVFRNFDPAGEKLADYDLKLLTNSGEVTLIKRLSEFPKLIESAAAAHEPHRIAFYLYGLASELHAQWNRGKDKPQLRFIREDDVSITSARLALVKAVSVTIATGLSILGVQAPDEMR